MALVPNSDDLAEWIGITNPSNLVEAQLSECIDASVDEILDRCTADILTGTSEDTIPQTVRTAMLLYGGRIYKRRSSPEGVAAFGEVGAIRVSNIDVDVEALLGRYLKYDGFA